MFKVTVNNTESASIIYAGQSVLIEVSGAPKTGARGMTWRGAYVAETAYVKDDAVSYLGSSYIAKVATTGNLPTNTTYWDLVAQKGDGGAGSVDLGYTASPSGGTVTNSVGEDATIPAVDNTNAGLMIPAQKTKLDNIEAGADVTDATNVAAAGAFMKSADDADDITAGATNKFATQGEKDKLGNISITQPVDLDALESRVNELDAAVILKGSWDASAGTFPGGGSAQAGWSYIVSVAGTVNGVSFSVNDRIIAITDNASTSTFASNWFKADYTDLVTSVDGATGALTVGGIIAAAGTKDAIADTDTFGFSDSESSNATKKTAWSNIKAKLYTYFATIFQAISTNLTDLSSKWTAASASGPASLQFHEDTDNGTNKVTIQAPSSLSSDYTMTLPSDDGNANDVLKTDGNGNLSWTPQSSGSGSTYTPGKFSYRNDYLVINSDASFGGVNFQNSSSGTGATVTYKASEKGAQGVITVQKGTTTTGRGNFWHPKGYNTICLGDNGVKMWFRFKLNEAVPDATNDYVIRHGFTQNVSGDGTNDIVFIIGRGINSGKLSVRYRSAGTTRFDLDTTITPSTSWQEVYLEMDPSTHVISVYNTSGTLLATSSAPATKITKTEIFAIADTINGLAGTVNRTYDSDHFHFDLT